MPKVVFKPMDVTVDVAEGESLLEAAHGHHVPLEGACEGQLACSTCHVVVDPAWYRRLPPPSEDEEDILDRAFGVTATSRLGCQIIMTPELDGLVVTVPEYTLNMDLRKRGRK